MWVNQVKGGISPKIEKLVGIIMGSYISLPLI